MLEKSIERHLVGTCKRLGGSCVKLIPEGNTGLPDRLCILPGGRTVYVELKRPVGGRYSAKQLWWQEHLRGLGHEVHGLHTKEMIDDLFLR